MGAIFICGRCKKAFECGRSDEEALSEMRKEFGDLSPGERACVCEDCYKAFLQWTTKNTAVS
jgi:hypothetical protein